MDIEVVAEDGFGGDAYSRLFEEIMSDLNKAVLIERAKLVLMPARPLFIFSLVLNSEPSRKTIADVANVRVEGPGVHLTITQERYAPQILSLLWKRYGRSKVVQQTRFDLDVEEAKESEMSEMVVTSGEEDMREMIGAVWRTMPEGIKNRRVLLDGNVLTVVATEELMEPDMLAQGRDVHVSMGGSADV